MDDIRPPKKPKLSIALPPPGQQPTLPSLKKTVLDQPVVQNGLKLLAPPKPSKKRRFIIGGIIAFLLLIIATVGYGWWWYNDALQPRSTTQTRQKLTVANGATMEHIAQELETKGVIKSALALEIYVKQQGKDKLQAGTYLFSPTQTVAEIVSWLNDGKTDSYNLTILPGKTLVDIKTKLIKDGFEASAIDQAFAKSYDHPLLKTKPAGVSLEGYIFPETYQITSETTVEQLLIKTFDELNNRIKTKGLEAELTARGFTIHQGMTLASIMQQEVSSDSERRQVAEVFEKRLALGMPLGSDVTALYAAKLQGKSEIDVSIDSPYNTRKHAGLPPGPIANFNFTALEAVANPAPGDYLYFVSGDDGVTHFARTLEEHNKNVQQYCSKLCSGG